MSEMSSIDIDVGSPQRPSEGPNDLMKSRIDNFDIDSALVELKEVIEETARLYQTAKKAKFDYLGVVGDLYSRMDIPSYIMATAEKTIRQDIPSAKSIRKTY